MFKIMTYEDKLEVANKYLKTKIGFTWDDLPDINSLHDVCDIEDIHEFCDKRLEEIGGGFLNGD